MLFLDNKMDVKASYDDKKVGLSARGKKKYAWFAESELVWEELQNKLDSKSNWTHTFENGSVLKVTGDTCVFTGINGRQRVFKVQCDSLNLFGAFGHAKTYAKK